MNTINHTTPTTTKTRRGFDLYTAPSCEPNILAGTPQLIVANDGTHQIALASPNGEPDLDNAEIVKDVTFIKGTALVFIRTRTMGLVMNQDDYMAGLPKLSSAEFRARDLRIWVEAATYGLMHHAAVRLDQTADRLWHTAGELLQGDAFDGRLAHLLMLNALIASPEAVQQGLRALRDEYVAAHAELRLAEGHDA